MSSNIGTLPPGSIILGNVTENETGASVPPGVLGMTSLLDGWQCKQGDDALTFRDALTYSDGSPADLTGATVALVMRNLAAATPVFLSGAGVVSDPSGGTVQYKPSAEDTALAGDYTSTWIVSFSDGTVMTFPSLGYIAITIEPAMDSEPQMFVDLETIKRYPGMSIEANDRHLDVRLIDFIQAVQPLIEHVTGPILPTIFEEWHDGGQNYIQLRHRPSVGYGTTPVLDLIACSEYNGPIEWPLAVIQSPDQGQMYSCQLDARLGRVVRRTAGGGVQPFPYQPEAVHVVYQAGQTTVPANVRLAVCESVRLYWQTVQPIGTGRRNAADQLNLGPASISVLPPSVERLLQPTRRHPSVA